MQIESKAEVIKCKCGEVIAACVVGWQDAEWDRNRRNYMRRGYSVDIVPMASFRVVSCNCVKKPEAKQAELF